MHRSVDSPAVEKYIGQPAARTLIDAWATAGAMPRDRAQRDRNKAMHVTLGQVRGRIKPAAVEVLRVLIDCTFPDKIRRAGGNLILRIDHLSVGTIAKRAGWCEIDERDATRLAAAGTITDEARRSLLAAKRRVDRALAQLQAAGLITRTRRAGGRSITLIELRAPFDAEEPGATPPPGDITETLAPGDSSEKPAARNDANVAPEGITRGDRNVAPPATQTSQPERHERRHRCDENVAPSPPPSPSPTPKPHTQQTNTRTTSDATTGGGGVVAGCVLNDDEEARRVPDTDATRTAERRRMLAAAGIRGKMLDELSRRRLSMGTIASIIADAEEQTSLSNPPGFIITELQCTPDDDTDDAPARRYWPKPATIAAAVEQVDEGRDAAEVFDTMTAGLSTPNRIDWLHAAADWLNLNPTRALSSDKLATMPEVRREVSEALIASWKCANGRGEE